MASLPNLSYVSSGFSSTPISIDPEKTEGSYTQLTQKVHRLSRKRRAENPVPANSEKETNNKLKKRKIEPAPYSPYDFPEQVMEHIVSFLPSTQDILNFELASRTHQNYTQQFWKKKNTQENHNLIFPFATTNDKQRYLLFRVFFVFIHDLWSYECFDYLQGTRKVYPSQRWNNSIPPELHNLLLYSSHKKFSHGVENPYAETTENLRRDIFEKTSSENASPGYLVLRALMESSLKEVVDCLLLAAENNSSTSPLAVQLLYNQKTSEPAQVQVKKDRCFEIACLAMKKNDYRALNYCLNKWPDLAYTHLDIKHCSAYSLLINARHRMANNDHLGAELQLLQAMNLFEDNAPYEFYFDLARTKQMLGKWSEADFFFEKGFACRRTGGWKILLKELGHAAVGKVRLRKYKEADSLFTQLHRIFEVNNYKEARIDFFIYASDIKNNLGNFEAAESLQDQGFKFAENRKIKTPSKLLATTAYTKEKLGKTEEAEQLYKELLHFDTKDKEANICLGRIAFRKLTLGKFKEAENHYLVYLHRLSLNNETHPKALANLALVKLKLGNKREAYDLANQALPHFNHKPFGQSAQTLLEKVERRLNARTSKGH